MSRAPGPTFASVSWACLAVLLAIGLASLDARRMSRDDDRAECGREGAASSSEDYDEEATEHSPAFGVQRTVGGELFDPKNLPWLAGLFLNSDDPSGWRSDSNFAGFAIRLTQYCFIAYTKSVELVEKRLPEHAKDVVNGPFRTKLDNLLTWTQPYDTDLRFNWSEPIGNGLAIYQLMREDWGEVPKLEAKAPLSGRTTATAVRGKCYMYLYSFGAGNPPSEPDWNKPLPERRFVRHEVHMYLCQTDGVCSGRFSSLDHLWCAWYSDVGAPIICTYFNVEGTKQFDGIAFVTIESRRIHPNPDNTSCDRFFKVTSLDLSPITTTLWRHQREQPLLVDF